MSKKPTPTNEATTRIWRLLLNDGLRVWRQNSLPVPMESGGFRPGSQAGLPDLCAIYRGRGGHLDHEYGPCGTFVGVEIKRGRDRLRPAQVGFHLEARSLGAIIITAYGDTADEIVNDFKEQWDALKN